MKLQAARPGTVVLTLARQELAAIMAAVHMSLDALRADPAAPAEAVRLLELVVGDYERAIRRLEGGRLDDDGRP